MTIEHHSPITWSTASPLLVGLLAGAGALAATPLVRGLARRTGFVDVPAPRKLHATPTPLLGGLAIVGAVLLALGFGGGRGVLSTDPALWIAACGIAAVGLYDDRYGLSPALKLGGQVAAAAAIVVGGPRLHLQLGDGWNFALTMLWIVAITNTFNLLDNMDGLCAGVAASTAAGLLALALMYRQPAIATLAAAVLGATVGFLAFNSSPASIFLGDCGSLFLGFLLAALSVALELPALPITASWIVLPLLFAVPLFDTTLVTLSRLRRGLNPLSTPGKDHLSHRLARAGFGTARAVTAIAATSAATAALAVASASLGGAAPLACGLAVAALFVGGLWYWERPPHLAAIEAERR